LRITSSSIFLALLLWCTPAQTATHDTYLHKSGLFSFPTSLATLIRTAVKSYDDASNDVGVSYQDPESRLLVTIYAFPAPKLRDGTISSLEQHFRAEDATILGKWPNSSQAPWPEELPMWSDEGVPGVLQAYALDGGKTGSILQLYDYEGWRLKFRSTFLAGDAKHAVKLIDEVHEAFSWPTDLQQQGASAGS
jgi:hypothetical protein